MHEERVWDVYDGELNYFLGLQIKQRSDGIFINQAKYTRKLIKKFGREGAKISKTPMATTIKHDKDEQGINIYIKVYRSMIGSLLYLTASKSDIMFSGVYALDFNLILKSLT